MKPFTRHVIDPKKDTELTKTHHMFTSETEEGNA